MPSDAELVDRVRRGNIEAFEQLIDRYEKTLLATALAATHDIHTAEDVVQATFLLAFRNLGSLQDAGKFGSWLLQIARRQVIDTARARTVAATVPLDNVEIAESFSDAFQSWIDNEHLLDLVDQLPEHERVLIGLRYFDGHGMAEIAEILGRPIGTVTKQLSRATIRLRSWYEKENQQ